MLIFLSIIIIYKNLLEISQNVFLDFHKFGKIDLAIETIVSFYSLILEKNLTFHSYLMKREILTNYRYIIIHVFYFM
jgi:hypothetical protein